MATQATPGVAGSTARSQVIAAYTGYWQAYGIALRTRNIGTARKLLARFAAQAFVSEVTASLPRLWAGQVIGYGYAVPHVLSFTRTGASSALLHDCLDLSHLGTQDVKTGQVVPGSFGLPTVDFYVTLVRSGRSRSGQPGSGQPGSGQHWVVTKMQQVEVPCTP
ncbi:MAG TPA: hypothetical protein VN840_20640 [Streptosporangiaceae bacterium]|nr:hypothetical protein [Streptosporangiaceae bacterium]